MIGKLRDYIDKEPFLENLSQAISNYEQIIVDLFVSNTCNLHCKHCYFLDYNPEGESLSLQKWFEIIDECVRIGIRNFHFSGKEPFCEKHIPLVLERLNQLSMTYDIRYGLVTNGTLLNSNYLRELLNSKLSYLEFSLEGDKDFNLNIRGTNSFETVYNLIKDLPNKSKLNLTSTFWGNNLHELEDMIGEFIKIGVRKFNIAPYLRFDKMVLLPMEELYYNQMIDLVNHFRRYLDITKQESIDIRICLTRRQAFEMFTDKNSMSDEIHQYIYNGKRIVYELGNNVVEVNYPLLYIPFLTQLIITNDGYVIPCADDIHYKNLHEVSLGNVRDGGMESVLAKRKEYIISYINKKIEK